MRYFKFKGLLLKNRWLTPAYVGVDDSGIICYLSDEAPREAVALDNTNGLVLPGFQNAHSHAFQYAMVGLAENHPASTQDDFWSCREAMYHCALTLDPDEAEAVATQLYAEMLRHGYTHVAEFHYLHHDKEGKPYDNLTEMGERMIAAAQKAGIKITLVPVFYQKGNFGKEPQPRQRRFISKSVDAYLKLLEASKRIADQYGKLGASIHSLRAVEPEDVIRTVDGVADSLPFHIHVAEQKKEVQDCLKYCQKRPMQWLLDNVDVNERFFLVHSTHLDDEELNRLAGTGATVVLCPSTEGNLGDGIFRMKEYTAKQGHWCIGTDSHIGLNPLDEFRMIDYRQRLLTNKRNTFEGDAARYLINEEITSGRRAMGYFQNDHFAMGQPFDAVVYDAELPLLSVTSEKNWLSTLVYGGDITWTYGTIVNGRWVVKRGHHQGGEMIKADFQRVLRKLATR